MNETAFETIASAASVLKLDFSSQEFAGFAEDHGLQIGSGFSDKIWFVTPDIFWSETPDANSYLPVTENCWS